LRLAVSSRPRIIRSSSHGFPACRYAEPRSGASLRQRREDAAIAWTFFRQWLKAPLTTAAVSPSSKELAAEMLSQLPDGARKVIELGGGTGVFTEALLERGIAPENLLVFELNESLHQHLMQRFPQTRVVCADALSTARVVEREKFARAGEVDAVISGLGLFVDERGVAAGNPGGRVSA
jgi:phosphatidylethanolamine/phosphatidyl-N-methylethanolamine N-methyltransferase